jgi:hypothetical protein
MNPIKVTQIIQRQRNKITETSMKIIESFIKLIKINPFIAKRYFRVRYLSQLEKQIDNRFITKDLTRIGKTISHSTLNDEDQISNSTRRKYLKIARNESCRGLPFQKNLYEFYKYPIMFEQIWEPEISEDSEASDTSSGEYSSVDIKGDHLIFLLHGYKGK